MFGDFNIIFLMEFNGRYDWDTTPTLIIFTLTFTHIYYMHFIQVFMYILFHVFDKIKQKLHISLKPLKFLTS